MGVDKAAARLTSDQDQETTLMVDWYDRVKHTTELDIVLDVLDGKPAPPMCDLDTRSLVTLTRRLALVGMRTVMLASIERGEL
jgi:hypothetical protein